jgi:hypothetical protein
MTTTSIVQRYRECSLAAICNLNGLTQEAYEALSDKVRAKHGVIDGLSPYRKRFKWIAYSIRIAKAASLHVPKGYHASRVNAATAGRDPDLDGKGILTISFFKKKHRKPYGRHAVAFDSGAVIESDGRRYASWEAYLEACDAHRIRIDRIFR